MAKLTITAANSIFVLNIPDVSPVPQVLQGYATDEAFGNEAVDSAEAIMGVDGKMSAGFTPYMTKMPIQLQADSPSIQLFDDWLGAMAAAREVFFAQGSIQLPSVKRGYTMSNGVLTKSKQMPDVKKLLQPVQYEITWEGVALAPIN